VDWPGLSVAYKTSLHDKSTKYTSIVCDELLKNVVFALVVVGTEQVGVAVAEGVNVEVGVNVRVAVRVAVAVCVEGVVVIVCAPESDGVSVGATMSLPTSFSVTERGDSDVMSPSKKPTKSSGGLGSEVS